jgi:hypothetical protein
MKRPTIFALASTLTVSLVAQSAHAGPQQKMITQYRGWMDLMGMVYSLVEMDKQPALALSTDQAKQVLPILKNLSSREDLRPNEAISIIDKLKKEVLPTPKQKQYLEAASQKRDADMRQASGSGGQPNLPFIKFGPSLFGMVQAMQNDKQPYNPFRGGPGEDNLKKLSTAIEKR